ncbi:hypothetical protein SEA_SAPO_42 [Gordonia phage Sapo]|nr:hypothetical protein SEA_SAPO_42 [Gordonia phage Sapo]
MSRETRSGQDTEAAFRAWEEARATAVATGSVGSTYNLLDTFDGEELTVVTASWYRRDESSPHRHAAKEPR